MRVIGIDPGVAVTGYAVVERVGGRLIPCAAGVVRTDPAFVHAARLAGLRAELAGLMASLHPDVAAVERLFFNANVKTAMAVGQASGVVLVTAAEAGLEVAEYTPPEIKLAVVGTGGATKHQVQGMVAALLGLRAPPAPADAADACALAIAHLNRSRLAGAVTAARTAAP